MADGNKVSDWMYVFKADALDILERKARAAFEESAAG